MKCETCGKWFGGKAPIEGYVVNGECRDCWIERVRAEEGEAETLLGDES